MTYKTIPNIEGLECSYDGLFRYKGKPKKMIYCKTVNGRKATVRCMIMIGGKSHYWQAAKLVAQTWLRGYKDGDYLTYKDGDCHNIAASNLVVEDKKGYYEYMRRNSGFTADTLQERKRKLRLVADESLMTLRYFETLKMDEINRHVKEYLYPCLMEFAMNTLHLGEKTSLEAVPEAIGTMYEKIMDGMCLYNYERFCKKMLHTLKKKGSYGEYWWELCKPIKIEVEQLNLDCLWERYKVTKSKK